MDSQSVTFFKNMKFSTDILILKYIITNAKNTIHSKSVVGSDIGSKLRSIKSQEDELLCVETFLELHLTEVCGGLV